MARSLFFRISATVTQTDTAAGGSAMQGYVTISYRVLVTVAVGCGQRLEYQLPDVP